jgi:hypothetical protein
MQRMSWSEQRFTQKSQMTSRFTGKACLIRAFIFEKIQVAARPSLVLLATHGQRLDPGLAAAYNT